MVEWWNGGTAACSDEVPDTLYLQWTRRLLPQQPAWRDEPALQYDAGYLPVVLDGRTFVGSTRADHVTAYDLATGRKLWRFYTGTRKEPGLFCRNGPEGASRKTNQVPFLFQVCFSGTAPMDPRRE